MKILTQTSARAGRYVQQTTGYKAFIPKPLPPDPPLRLGAELQTLLSAADQALARLDGTTLALPNADLFVAMYVRQEAVLSSQIEGTQSSLIDVLEFEASDSSRELPRDVHEVYNYVRAMNLALERAAKLPLSLRLIREIHSELMRGVRGGDRTPGEFRRSQNWIGPPGATLNEAIFVPPPVHEMNEALHQLEKFLYDPTPMPVLLRCALVHSQFETIHPFLDGNGRIGRLLITFMLCTAEVLSRPLLYLSLFLKENRNEYYDRLMGVRLDGDWEGWIGFFLRGVREVSKQATDLAKQILVLQTAHRRLIGEKLAGSTIAMRLLDYLYQHPILSVKQARKALDVSFPTANSIARKFVELGMLVEMTGRRRDRLFSYKPYIELFDSIGNRRARAKGPVQTSLFGDD